MKNCPLKIFEKIHNYSNDQYQDSSQNSGGLNFRSRIPSG